LIAFGWVRRAAVEQFVSAVRKDYGFRMEIVDFHLAIEGQQANPEWERKMAGLSGEFSAIRRGEGEWRPSEGWGILRFGPAWSV
jgi:hypothetical protein